MLVRIVKLSFHEENIAPFLANFEQVKFEIRNAPGNRLLELYQDQNDKTTFFTYSYWATAQDLDNYRKSALFLSVWAYTKTLFKHKPEAWSVNKIASLQ